MCIILPFQQFYPCGKQWNHMVQNSNQLPDTDEYVRSIHTAMYTDPAQGMNPDFVITAEFIGGNINLIVKVIQIAK